MKSIWVEIGIPVMALLLVLGCGDEPDRKIGGAANLSEIGTTDSDSKSAPRLSDQQLAEGSGSSVDDHPPIPEDQKNVHREIIVPKSVEGKWKAVKILVRDKTDEERNTMKTVELGSTFQLGDSGITVHAAEFFPNFVLDPACPAAC